jgi:hypothetical protein
MPRRWKTRMVADGPWRFRRSESWVRFACWGGYSARAPARLRQRKQRVRWAREPPLWVVRRSGPGDQMWPSS